MQKKKLLVLAVATAIAGTTMLGVTSATSDYMHYQDGTISICDPSSNGTKCITMQDKNLGASEAGTGTSSYGYHFQRGNNHGFEIGCFSDGCADTVTNGATSTLAIWSGAYNHVGYVGNLFIKGTSSSNYDYWSDNTPHNGLRGGENDTGGNNYGYDEENNVAYYVENRQGPCGEGYHVPSIGEWNQVLEYWAEENGIELEDDGGLKYNYTTLDGLKFQEDFKIPFAGGRNYLDARVFYMGDHALLWSSSPRVGYSNARYFYLTPNEADANYLNFRARAFSLRCFKDSYLSFPSSEGGDSEIIVNIEALNGGQNTCSGEDFIFPAITASPVVQTIKLAKKFQCVFGNAANKAVTLHLSGDLTDGNGNVIPGANVKLSNPEWTSTPTGLKNGTTAFSGQTFMGGGKTLFNKVENMIGEAQGSGVQIEITVPAGTPDGTYQGTIILDF